MINETLAVIIPKAGLVLTGGGIRTGKSCLVYGIAEHLHLEDPQRPVFAYNFPREKADTLPEWIKPITTEDFPDGSVVLADEAYMSFYAKDHNNEVNRYMDIFSGLAGQKDILIIFVTQTFRKLTLATVSSVQVVLLKCPDVMMAKLDRSELRKMTNDALKSYRGLPAAERQQALYIVSMDFEGLLEQANTPPEFWTEELSKAWQGVSLVGEEPRPKRAIDEFGPVLCHECSESALDLCKCCRTSWCAEHLAEHEAAAAPV